LVAIGTAKLGSNAGASPASSKPATPRSLPRRDLFCGAITVSLADSAEIAAISTGCALTARQSFLVRLFLSISRRPAHSRGTIFRVDRYGCAFIAEGGNHFTPRPCPGVAVVRQCAGCNMRRGLFACSERLGSGDFLTRPSNYKTDCETVGDSAGSDAYDDGSFGVGSIVPHQKCRQGKQRHDYAPPHSIALFYSSRVNWSAERLSRAELIIEVEGKK
jgi:hypothetical protein